MAGSCELGPAAGGVSSNASSEGGVVSGSLACDGEGARADRDDVSSDTDCAALLLVSLLLAVLSVLSTFS